MILDQEWREDHVRDGDQALEQAREAASHGLADGAVALAQIAQAHYLAANVRAKPAMPEDQTEYLKALGDPPGMAHGGGL